MCNPSSSFCTNSSFNWESNNIGMADEDTPFLDWKKEYVLDEEPSDEPFDEFPDPFDEFLSIPYHSSEKEYLPELFLPLCSNESVLECRSPNYKPPNRIVAWMDDSNRDYSGVMTGVQFRENLPKKVETSTILDVYKLTTGQRLNHRTLPDAPFRRIHITDPRPHTVTTLICTAPEKQAPVLREFLKRHVKAEGLMSVRFVDGIHAFVMEFHLPFWVWGDGATGSKREDDRRTWDDNPLRRTRDLTFLTRPTESEINNGDCPSADCLYEAQSSCVVTGYSNSYWTAISLADTYFYPGGTDSDSPDCDENNEDMLPFYKGENDLDPLTIAKFARLQKSLDPRQYFLVVLKERLNKARGEWESVVYRLSLKVKHYPQTPEIMFPASEMALEDTGRQTKVVYQSYEWVTGLMDVLDMLQVTLSKLTKACVHFDQYGLPALVGPEPSSQLVPYIQEIQQSFHELHNTQEDLANMCHRAQQFKQQIQYFGAPTLAAGLYQANVLEGATFIRFLVSSVVIAILGFVVQRLRDILPWSSVWDRLVPGRRPYSGSGQGIDVDDENPRVNVGSPLG
ncbi:hypothetical protein PG985_003968 [Apiospora marii]|uniref:uncharacterized protein n=1 Tax=Apiospora marii TaxID=335849 RepID=UPI00312D6E91